MEVSRIRALRGPNLWSRNTSVEAVVRCSDHTQTLATLPGFEDRIRGLFPAIGPIRHRGFEGPVSLAHVLEAATLALQAQAGCPVSFSRTTETVEPGVFQVVVQYTEEAVGRKALVLAQELIQAALTKGSFDTAKALADLQELDEDERLGPSTGC
ncbi:MAG: hypothetical protein RL459_1775, partial [Pseudomonadota bacterium]